MTVHDSIKSLIIIMLMITKDNALGSVTLATANAHKTMLRLSQTSSVLEPAGTHSYYRFYAGLSLKTFSLPLDYSDVWEQQSQQQSKLYIPQASITTGLTYPLDFSISIARHEGLNYQQVSGSVQWSLYEAFAMPAVAARASFANGKIWNQSSLKTWTFDIISSWGYKMLTAYLGLGLAFDTFTYTDTVRPLTERSQSTLRMMGLQLQVLPSLFYIVVESNQNSAQQNTLSLKLATEV